MGDKLATALLSEITEVLARYGSLRCVPGVEAEDGEVTITLVFPLNADDTPSELHTCELHNEMRYVRDVASIRGLAARYGIDSAKLEDLLQK
jgi:hypothetical protein